MHVGATSDMHLMIANTDSERSNILTAQKLQSVKLDQLIFNTSFEVEDINKKLLV